MKNTGSLRKIAYEARAKHSIAYTCVSHKGSLCKNVQVIFGGYVIPLRHDNIEMIIVLYYQVIIHQYVHKDKKLTNLDCFFSVFSKVLKMSYAIFY